MNISKKSINSNRRDRFILSKGHAAAALYSVLYLKGLISKKLLYSFGSNEGGLCEHPEISTPGVEMSTGSLGHGLAFSIGIALGLKSLRFIKSRVFVLISDGECGEGSIWEAALLAPLLRLSNLMVIIDDNRWQCFGPTQKITNLSPLSSKWKSFGWNVVEIDGHNIQSIVAALKSHTSDGNPTVIIAHTKAGRGVTSIENKQIGHYKVFSEDEYHRARLELLNL